VNVCPGAFFNASADRVWSVLSDPTRYDAWWDAQTDAVDPPGPVQPGQTILGSSRALGRRWRIMTKVEAVEGAHRRLRLRTALPMGLVIVNTISCSPVSPDRTRVQFG